MAHIVSGPPAPDPARRRPLLRRWWIGSGLALIVAGAAWAWFSTSRVPPCPGLEGSLVVWVVNNDSRGVAIALNEIRDAKARNLRFFKPGKPDPVEISLRDALVPILDGDAGKGTPTLRVEWDNAARARVAPHGPTRKFRIDFKFAPYDGLLDLWNPLYHRLAWTKGNKADPRPPRSPAAPKFDKPAWLDEMEKDLRDKAGRTLILGPDGSDSVPALWFALCDMRRDTGWYPPIVSLSASSSLLDYDRDELPAYAKPGLEAPKWLPPKGDPGTTGPNWHTSLARMRGYCEDDFQHVTPARRAEVESVVRAIQDPARCFIQFSASDKVLVQASLDHLRHVQGFRRMGILCPEQARAAPSDSTGRPAGSLYGPTLREEYESRAGSLPVRDSAVVLSATYPRAVRSEGKGAAPPAGNAEALRPTLRFFRQSGVEAIGVFGTMEDKLPVLRLIREEWPQVQIFTTDADWRLESERAAPTARNADAQGTAERKEGGPTRGGAALLEGLLVFTNNHPPRRWIEAQFLDFGPFTHNGSPFLPDVFQFYQAHAVKRLFEMVQEDRLGLLVGPERVMDLSNFLHEPTNLGRSNHRGGSSTIVLDDPTIEIMTIQDGRLGPLVDAQDMYLSLGFVILLLVVIGFQYLARSWRRDGPPAQNPENQIRISPLYYFWHILYRLWAWAARRTPPGGLRSDSAEMRARWFRVRGTPTLFIAACASAFLAVLLALLALDVAALGRAVSWSLRPDGHSVLPSVLLAGLAVVLAHHLPYRFEGGLSRHGLLRLPQRRPSPSESWVLRRWAPPFSDPVMEATFDSEIKAWLVTDVIPDLELTPNEATASAACAAALVAIEAAYGLPLPGGFAYAWLLLGEFALYWIVIATAWTLYQVSGMPDKLRRRLGDHDNLRLAHLDTSSVLRLGSIFIETIAYLLVVLGLLLVARLPEYNMARWKRFDLLGVPLGAFAVAVLLACILWYWLHCYTSLKELIRAVKADRLDELEYLRSKVHAHSARPEGLPSDQEWEVLKNAADDLEKQRRAIEEVPEEPWHVGASWRAWLALGFILLPPLLSTLLGTWGDAIIRPLRLLVGGV